MRCNVRNAALMSVRLNMFQTTEHMLRQIVFLKSIRCAHGLRVIEGFNWLVGRILVIIHLYLDSFIF